MRYYFLIAVWFSALGIAQQKYTLSGTVSDAKTQETLLGVSVLIPELQSGVITNSYGFYSVSLPQGDYTIIVQYLGYATFQKQVTFDQDQLLDIKLKSDVQSLDEVVVTTDVEQINIRKAEMSVNRMSSKTIQQTPTVLGEADVLKAIQLLPGVTSAGEGASGFNVRGGAADQNLILLDEAVLYNSSHLFGFFSVFNPDAIKDLQLYKGGIPAQYGGRLSSVLSIYQKEGRKDKIRVNGGLGLVSSKLLAEGPLGKGSFLVAGRGTYAHLFLKLSGNSNSAYFYDLNTKMSFPINDNNKLYVSGYFGRDVFEVNESFANTYGNTVFNLRWNHLFSDKLFSNASIIYSDYYYGLLLEIAGFDWDSGIQNLNIKYDFNYFASPQTKFNFGLQSTYFHFNPGTIKPSSEGTGINPESLQPKYALESGAYVDANLSLSDAISLQLGLRLNHFIRLPQNGINTYLNDASTVYNPNLGGYEAGIVTGSFDGTKSSATYTHLEPRITLAYSFEKSSVKFSYNRLHQYLHLISNTASPTPLDVWTPSGPHLKPQQVDQWAMGYFGEPNSSWSFQTEWYYKDVTNRLDYVDGADLIANEAIEEITLPGKVRAYGWEVLVKKNSGRLQAWLSYTLSKSEQQTQTNNGPGINKGKWYRTAHDKTHDLSISAAYKQSEKWDWNANFIFQTGQPVTYPVSQYEMFGVSIPNFGLRNGSRLPVYHRLDVSATLHPKKYIGKKQKAEWIFGIYNLYNRRNASSISFRQNLDTRQNEAVRLSIFGAVPAITYKFIW